MPPLMPLSCMRGSAGFLFLKGKEKGLNEKIIFVTCSCFSTARNESNGVIGAQ